MNTPYRTDCSRCLELANELSDSESENTRLKAKIKDRRFKSVWDAMACGGIFSILVGGILFGSFAMHACAVKPDPVMPCFDSVMIISQESHVKSCHPGATMTLEKLQGDRTVLMQCRCSPSAASIIDAGANDQ